jgi:GNAT superfamily N-acetyltransferase
MKRRILLVLTALTLSAPILAPKPAEAGIGEAYLNLCRRVLFRTGWIKEVALAQTGGTAYWVTDPRELIPVSDALVDAFSADPLFLWTTPEPRLRRDLIYTLVRHAYMNGGVLTTANPGEGAALWFESSEASAGPLSILLTGQAFIIPRVGMAHTLKLLALDNFLNQTRSRLIKEANTGGSAIYLYMVGVRETFRGQGLASKLVKPVTEYADATGQAVLLETHKLDNIRIYEHLGFRIRNQETVPEDAPMTTSMVRLPNAGYTQ